jgi:hypothetical protein
MEEEVAGITMPAKAPTDSTTGNEVAGNINPVNSIPAIVAIEEPVFVKKEPTVTSVITEPVAEKNAKTVYTTSQTAIVETESGRSSYSFVSLHNQAERLKQYAQKKGFDTNYAFMIDMGMKSGKKRFFVMDLNTMTIAKRGIVAQSDGSNGTSPGIYKVGSVNKGNFGISYRLSGLEESNSNANKQAITLNALGCIPQEESDAPICQSLVNPSLSPAFLKEIAKIIDSRNKPMLLLMFDPVTETVAPGRMAYK